MSISISDAILICFVCIYAVVHWDSKHNDNLVVGSETTVNTGLVSGCGCTSFEKDMQHSSKIVDICYNCDHASTATCHNISPETENNCCSIIICGESCKCEVFDNGDNNDDICRNCDHLLKYHYTI